MSIKKKNQFLKYYIKWQQNEEIVNMVEKELKEKDVKKSLGLKLEVELKNTGNGGLEKDLRGRGIEKDLRKRGLRKRGLEKDLRGRGLERGLRKRGLRNGVIE